MRKGLNEQAETFRTRPLAGVYPILWVDALYEKVRYDGKVISMANVRLLSIYLLEYSEDWSTGRAYLSQESLETIL